MSSFLMYVYLGSQPKSCDNQWLRLTPRWILKPEGSIADFSLTVQEASANTRISPKANFIPLKFFIVIFYLV